MEKLMNKFVLQLRKINGENLVSAVRFSGNRLMVVLHKIGYADLLKNSALGRSMELRGIIPLFLTEENIRTSCDVFPLEYSVIKHGGQALFGLNILENIDIPDENIRLESEQKIKGCLIRLTQVILEKSHNINLIRRTIFHSLEDLLSGIAGLLELTKKGSGHSPEEMTTKLQEVSGMDLTPLLKVLQWRTTKKARHAAKICEDYFETVKALAVYADNPPPGKQ